MVLGAAVVRGLLPPPVCLFGRPELMGPKWATGWLRTYKSLSSVSHTHRPRPERNEGHWLIAACPAQLGRALTGSSFEHATRHGTATAPELEISVAQQAISTSSAKRKYSASRAAPARTDV